MIFDTIAALADFSDLDFDGDTTADQIVDKLIELREQGLLHTNFENLNVGGTKRANVETQEWKHFIRDLLAQKRTNFSEVEADMIAERVYRTRMYQEGNEVRENLASSSSSLSSSSSSLASISSSSSSVSNPVDPTPIMLVNLSWSTEEETRTFLGIPWSNGETKVLTPSYYTQAQARKETFMGSSGLTNIGALVTIFMSYSSVNVRKIQWDVVLHEATGTTLPVQGARDLNFRLETSDNAILAPAANDRVGVASYTFPTPVLNINTATWITDNAFGQITTNSGVTIQWQRGPGNWKIYA